MTDHVLRDRRLGQFESEFQEFPVNAWRAPARIGRAHLRIRSMTSLDAEGRPCG